MIVNPQIILPTDKKSSLLIGLVYTMGIALLGVFGAYDLFVPGVMFGKSEISRISQILLDILCIVGSLSWIVTFLFIAFRKA